MYSIFDTLTNATCRINICALQYTFEIETRNCTTNKLNLDRFEHGYRANYQMLSQRAQELRDKNNEVAKGNMQRLRDLTKLARKMQKEGDILQGRANIEKAEVSSIKAKYDSIKVEQMRLHTEFANMLNGIQIVKADGTPQATNVDYSSYGIGDETERLIKNIEENKLGTHLPLDRHALDAKIKVSGLSFPIS